jgi:hypothetical protein
MATTISGLLETYIDNKVADDKKGDWPRSVKDYGHFFLVAPAKITQAMILEMIVTGHFTYNCSNGVRK